MAVVITYDMEKFMRSCVDKYKALVQASAFGFAPVPVFPTSSDDVVAGRPLAIGAVADCLWCFHICRL
eukprot:11179732-Lingulodinium_polyedra.AAC.1